MQKDNTTLHRKSALRLSLLKRLRDPPVVCETHGGFGKVFEQVYTEVERGCVFETDAEKAEALAWQRPTWAVYQGDADEGLRAGAGAHLGVNVLDVDPYGNPWPVIAAYFESERPRVDRLCVAVNDGLRQALKLGQGWHTPSIAAALEHFGNSALYPRYLEVVRWNLARIVAACGYKVTAWAAYHCGHANAMTHYGALLER